MSLESERFNNGGAVKEFCYRIRGGYPQPRRRGNNNPIPAVLHRHPNYPVQHLVVHLASW